MGKTYRYDEEKFGDNYHFKRFKKEQKQKEEEEVEEKEEETKQE